MEEQRINLNGKNAKYYNIKNPTASQTAHFYGGNGFALGVYEPLLSDLAQHLNITALTMRGEWYDKPTADKMTREEDADVLIEFLQKTQDKPIIGIGHSQGATATTIAAAKRPDLFSALYLLEPVTFTNQQGKLYSLVPRMVKMTREPFKSTQVKQADWHSVDAYYQFLRRHKAYKRITDEHLLTYATNSLEAGEQAELTLRFSPKQELANYFGTPLIMKPLQQLIADNKVPVQLIIGKPSMFISQQVRQMWDKFVPKEQMTVLNDYGHLLPLEAPELCAKLIFQKLKLTS
ncbi:MULTISPECIES: alpha/beta fold hydrolase [Pseudomonadota]|uniref:alpha/beta fold hydrolase n=2 Tax=Gammaproteobacteria TaxID=1236 RepID=UPI0009771B8B|nr:MULTISPECIES: alpha/beta hydrolase [Pseudomonadota]ONG39919.1 alpha/beta hydrolase [Enhydrobacter sp. H5]VXB58682.1 Alpha/beta hydrolase [Enhydrobacter sp. AX1]